MMYLVARNLVGHSRRVAFEPSAHIGGGGAGIVFRDAAQTGVVVKLYKKIVDPFTLRPGTATPQEVDDAKAKISAMLSAPPDQQVAHAGGTSFTQIAWPQEFVETPDGRFAGFTMREVDFGTSVALEQLFLEQGRKASSLPQDFEYRLVVAKNLAAVIRLIHSKGHAVVDLQPQNVRVYRRSGWVGMIDCDGYRIGGARTYPANFLRSEFAAPELQRSGGNVRADMGDQNQDRFALAFIVFSLLNDGVTPFNVSSRGGHLVPNDVESRIRDHLYGYGVQPHPQVQPAGALSIHLQFPASLRALFDRAFTGVGIQRPTAAEWADELQRLLAGASQCRTASSHGKSVIEGSCMLCARKAALDLLTGPKVSVTQHSYTGPATSPQIQPRRKPHVAANPTVAPAAPITIAPPAIGQRKLKTAFWRATALGLVSGVVGIGAAANADSTTFDDNAIANPVVATASVLIAISMLTAPKRSAQAPHPLFVTAGGWIAAAAGHALVATIVFGLGWGAIRNSRASIVEGPPPVEEVIQIEPFLPAERLVARSANLPLRSQPDVGADPIGYTLVDQDLNVVGRTLRPDGAWYQIVLARGEVAFLPASATRARPPPPQALAPLKPEVVPYPDPKQQCIFGTSVRFRTIPSLDDETIIGKFDNGDQVAALGAAPGPLGQWYEVVREDGKLGFVFSDYVRDCALSDNQLPESLSRDVDDPPSLSETIVTQPPHSNVVTPPSVAQFSGQPEYPSLSIPYNERGILTISACVSQRGRLSDVKLIRSSGYVRLDNAALRWLLATATRFEPAKDSRGASVAYCNPPYEFNVEINPPR